LTIRPAPPGLRIESSNVIAPAPANAPLGIYIHIPYCTRICPYCDFNSHVVAAIPEQAYTDALLRELDEYSDREEWRDRALQSIFFGGGTPSTFHPKSIGTVLERVHSSFDVLPDCEITLEANPGTVDAANFFGYREHGVNRISVGVQSFQPGLLKFLGRGHSAEDAGRALEIVRCAGFENFSLDLIYANPDQTLEDLNNDLDTALRFESPHLSAYNLTIEEGTPFHHALRNGKIRLLSEDQEIAMAALIEQRLREAGLERYEISNFARPGFCSRHNLNYWQGGDYLGVGAGAHSHRRIDANGSYGVRWWNEKIPSRYMHAIASGGQSVVETELADLRRAAAEFMFSGLRLMAGIAFSDFRARFKTTPLDLYPQMTDWISGGLIEDTGTHLRLTHRGVMVANALFVDFV
jgi:oxygen-independent coproporphyrinogen III oxidase